MPFAVMTLVCEETAVTNTGGNATIPDSGRWVDFLDCQQVRLCYHMATLSAGAIGLQAYATTKSGQLTVLAAGPTVGTAVTMVLGEWQYIPDDYLGSGDVLVQVRGYGTSGIQFQTIFCDIQFK